MVCGTSCPEVGIYPYMKGSGGKGGSVPKRADDLCEAVIWAAKLIIAGFQIVQWTTALSSPDLTTFWTLPKKGLVAEVKIWRKMYAMTEEAIPVDNICFF